jgi:predicted lipoprotein
MKKILIVSTIALVSFNSEAAPQAQSTGAALKRAISGIRESQAALTEALDTLPENSKYYCTVFSWLNELKRVGDQIDAQGSDIKYMDKKPRY